MTVFSCQDFRDRGLRLVSPADSDFGSLLEDIRRRTAAPHPAIAVLPWRASIPADLEFAAILRNQSDHAIAGLALEWRFEEADGRQTDHQVISAFAKQLLIPHSVAPELLRMTRYWSSILPGSKRLLAGAEMFGENTDARAPEPEEVPFGSGLGPVAAPVAGGCHRLGSGAKWSSRSKALSLITASLSAQIAAACGSRSVTKQSSCSKSPAWRARAGNGV